MVHRERGKEEKNGKKGGVLDTESCFLRFSGKFKMGTNLRKDTKYKDG